MVNNKISNNDIFVISFISFITYFLLNIVESKFFLKQETKDIDYKKIIKSAIFVLICSLLSFYLFNNFIPDDLLDTSTSKGVTVFTTKPNF